MENKPGIFDAVSGNPSSARVIGYTIICIALIISCFLAWWGKEDVIKGAGAIAIQFPAMTTPVFVYLFKNKQEEIQHEEVKQETVALITKLPSA